MTPRVTMELGSNEAIKRTIEAGGGIALVAARVVAREVADGRLRAVHLRGSRLALRFFSLHHRDRARAPVLRAFLALAIRPSARRRA